MGVRGWADKSDKPVPEGLASRRAEGTKNRGSGGQGEAERNSAVAEASCSSPSLERPAPSPLLGKIRREETATLDCAGKRSATPLSDADPIHEFRESFNPSQAPDRSPSSRRRITYLGLRAACCRFPAASPLARSSEAGMLQIWDRTSPRNEEPHLLTPSAFRPRAQGCPDPGYPGWGRVDSEPHRGSIRRKAKDHRRATPLSDVNPRGTLQKARTDPRHPLKITAIYWLSVSFAGQLTLSSPLRH